MDVLLVTVVLVVGVVLLIVGSVQESFVLVALSVACAATAGVVGVLSARQRRARADRLLAQLGPAELRAREAPLDGAPGEPLPSPGGTLASPHSAGEKQGGWDPTVPAAAGAEAAPSAPPSGQPATPAAAAPEAGADGARPDASGLEAGAGASSPETRTAGAPGPETRAAEAAGPETRAPDAARADPPPDGSPSGPLPE